MWSNKYAPERLNIGTKDELEVVGFHQDTKRVAVTVLGTILSCGLLLIPLTWRPSIKLSLTHKRCPISLATTVLLKDIHNQEWEEEVVREKKEEEKNEDIERGSSKESEEKLTVYFLNRKIKYIWEDSTCTFVKLKPLDYTPTLSKFHKDGAGLSQHEAERRLKLYGENYLEVAPPSVWHLLIHKVVNPYYICQGAVIIVWLIQRYYFTALTILGLSIASLLFSLYQTITQCDMLRKTVSSKSKVSVLRDGQSKSLSSQEVVPGDVVFIGADGTMSQLEVDAVLLEGSVVTNESMLTGEAIPVTKVSVPHDSDTLFDLTQHRHHVLQGGTQLLQVRGGSSLPALVLNTGFYTARGELVRSILYPKPHHLHLYLDLFCLLGVFVAFGLAAFGWSIYSWQSIGVKLGDTMLNSLDMLMFVVPPLLPAAITTVAAWAQVRLKHQHILTYAFNYILPAGSVDVICFDKTGTLTEEDLGLSGVLMVSGGEFRAPQEDLTCLPPDHPFTRALATCHSLCIVNQSLFGYPIDVKIFSAIDWVLQEMGPDVNPHYNLVTPIVARPQARQGVDPGQHELAVIRSFPFMSREQRMTVVTRTKVDGVTEVFMKGAPEKLAAICRRETVPGLLDAAVEWYTRQGLRVLAVAGKTFNGTLSWHEVQEMSREALEEGCGFLGLVVLQNKVKPETLPAITTLHTATYTTVMITGDNLLTAISVGRESGIVGSEQQVIIVRAIEAETTVKAVRHIKLLFYDSHAQAAFTKQGAECQVSGDYVFAVEGQTLEMLEHLQDKNLRQRVLHRAKIFARMKPHHKVMLVEALQSMGHHVAMCGDGCNDCGALRAANCGISLSKAEASMAAPFTSQQPDIGCVPILLKEGRAVLVSTVAAVKYNIITCFTVLLCVVFHYVVHTQPTDHQYVMLALGLMTTPSLVIGCTGPFPLLSPVRPDSRLLSPITIISILSYVGIQALNFWMMLSYIQAQPWYEASVYEGGAWSPQPSYENTCLYTLCCFSVTFAALVLSRGTPFTLPFYTNYVLLGYVILGTFFCTFMTFYTDKGFTDFLNLRPFPDVEAAGVLFCAGIICFVVSFIWEKWVLYDVVWGRLIPWCRSRCLNKRPLYEQLENDIRADMHWPELSPPPVEQFDQASSLEKLMEENENQTEGVNVFDLDVFGEESMLVRKLSRRHRFQASVKVNMKGSNTHTETHGILPAGKEMTGNIKLFEDEESIGFGSSKFIDNKHPEAHGILAAEKETQAKFKMFEDEVSYSSIQESVGFGSSKFNDSVRTQMKKGIGENLRTFRGTVKTKRQNVIDEDTAEPSESIQLTDTAHHPDNIDIQVSDSADCPLMPEPPSSSENLYDVPKKPRPLSGTQIPVAGQKADEDR